LQFFFVHGCVAKLVVFEADLLEDYCDINTSLIFLFKKFLKTLPVFVIEDHLKFPKLEAPVNMQIELAKVVFNPISTTCIFNLPLDLIDHSHDLPVIMSS
jgi:hypothetical protein